jgi:ATP-dependent Clp protease ATP-binding subunit ClpB
MRPDVFTVKAQEALERAQRLARERNHQNLTGEHLLVSLLEDKEGVVAATLNKLGVDQARLTTESTEALDRLPKVSGSADVYLSDELRQVLESADQERARLKDEFVSTEHLLLGLATGADKGAAQNILSRSGVTPELIYQALAGVRGGQRVTDPNPEDKYQALARYSRDLSGAPRTIPC